MLLQTERLLIRNFKLTDWEAVYEYTSDPVVMKYIPEGIFSKDDAQKFVEDIVEIS